MPVWSLTETVMKLLHIDSSILGENSASRRLTREIVSRWQAGHPDLQVKYTDLAAQELPHFSGTSLSTQDAAESARNAEAMADFLAADVVVIGAPMYNFSIPSQLKAWIDRITVAGKTFRYTAAGPQGLAGGKQVNVAISRGGVYAPNAPGEFAESYLRFLFAFLGIDTVTFVRAEGLAISPEHRRAGINSALAGIETPVSRAA
jgi:FMN-dependent NADH-azoreductase